MSEFKNDITYNQLSTFKTIVEAGNISKAAKLIGVSSASVSYSLKSLEKQIGQVLFNRTTRAITLTDIGRQLYDNTQFSIEELNKSVEVICNLNEKPSGILSLNMANTIYQWFLKDRLIDFQKAFPLIQLDLTLSDTLDNRVEKQFDIGFRYGKRVDDTLVARRLYPSGKQTNSFKAALFVSSSYAQTRDIPTSISELTTHPMVKFRMPSSRKLAPLRLHKTNKSESKILNIEPPTAMIVNDLGTLVDMVSQGFGMGMTIDFVLQDKFESGELIPLFQEHWCDIPNIYMYYARETQLSVKVRCFLEFVHHALK
ncbi:LysR family transcriptional regulator [Parashewanella tropica]|uniref:LysR family transcriptional regulator n=1 Tax=Parashewanella tropica TaxID=2547970 RepID=UPI00105A914B|nr:LysR family transcriptional regulator [Parashewanella tropica]